MVYVSIMISARATYCLTYEAVLNVRMHCQQCNFKITEVGKVYK
jgi:hypothetical protein